MATRCFAPIERDETFSHFQAFLDPPKTTKMLGSNQTFFDAPKSRKMFGNY
jgi:hypothetical protein